MVCVVVLHDNSFEDVINSLHQNWRLLSGHLFWQVLSVGIRCQSELVL
jgi:hypothetical protein